MISLETYYCYKDHWGVSMRGTSHFTKGYWYIVLHADSHHVYIYANPVAENFTGKIKDGIENSWGVGISEFPGYFCDKKTLRKKKLSMLEYKKWYESSMHKF